MSEAIGKFHLIADFNLSRQITAYTLIGLTLVLVACKPHEEPARTSFELTDIDPRSQVIGVAPNEPTDPIRQVVAAPAAISPVHTDVSAKQEAAKMPLPGQANDHSNLPKVPSQRTTKPTTP